MKTQAHQDYLKAIYAIAETLDWVTTSALSEHLGVRPSSVTSMVKKLNGARPKLVDYKSHHGVALTKAGRRIALDMTRRHRLIERFLVEIMGYGWHEVHDEADRLEHSVSERFIDRLDELLGYPTRDPHGRPIPSKSGEVQPAEEIRLADAPLNEALTVSSVGSEETSFLKYLGDIGLVPNVVLKVSKDDPTAGTLSIDIVAGQQHRRHVIGTQLAYKIFVSEMT
jgi:DtxR family transcriptional regulator, Mn-dependent transcriptional regulator